MGTPIRAISKRALVFSLVSVLLLVSTLLAMLLLVWGLGGAAAQGDTLTVTKTGDGGPEQTPANDMFLYSSKIVCVPHLGNASSALVDGVYRTAVNVHNPWPERAHITSWVTLSPPQGEVPIIGHPNRGDS